MLPSLHKLPVWSLAPHYLPLPSGHAQPGSQLPGWHVRSGAGSAASNALASELSNRAAFLWLTDAEPNPCAARLAVARYERCYALDAIENE